MDLDDLLRRAVDPGASDIHLKLGRPPMVRRDGAVDAARRHRAADRARISTRSCARSPRSRRSATTSSTSPAISTSPTPSGDLPRFRVNAFRQRGAISFALRVIPKNVPRFEDLGLPQGVRSLAEEHRGLVLVTGATGSGKTTTLAAMIDYINRSRAVAHRHDRGPDRDPAPRPPARSSTSARSASTPRTSARRSAARSARIRTRS